jgi:hypothetical protein
MLFRSALILPLDAKSILLLYSLKICAIFTTAELDGHEEIFRLIESPIIPAAQKM